MTNSPRPTRIITERLVICGMLTLHTPTLISNGDADMPTDMALLRDSREQRALLTGSTIAGALRTYLREWVQDADGRIYDAALFGAPKGDDDGIQSPLLVADALSTTLPEVELRDSVRIDPITRTARDQAKYDLEVLAAGTQFPLWFELLVQRVDEDARPAALSAQLFDRALLLQALQAALAGLEVGAIGIGMKKRRGLGECRVDQWYAWHFDLTTRSGRAAWLQFDHAADPDHARIADRLAAVSHAHGATIAGVLRHLPNLGAPALLADRRTHCTLTATFGLEGSLLVRAAPEEALAPDTVHIQSRHGGAGKRQPILPGTSLAGVLRHRAERIVTTLGQRSRQAESSIIRELFGWVDEDAPDPDRSAQSSRIVVRERIITVPKDSPGLTQQRIAIDRLTGGVMPGALFSERPIWANDATQLTIDLEIRDPRPHEIGLLLLLLKDLWTGDLPVGGGSTVGRGRLAGRSATLTVQGGPDAGTWTFTQTAGGLAVSDPTTLEQRFLAPLVAWEYP